MVRSRPTRGISELRSARTAAIKTDPMLAREPASRNPSRATTMKFGGYVPTFCARREKMQGRQVNLNKVGTRIFTCTASASTSKRNTKQPDEDLAQTPASSVPRKWTASNS